MKGVKKPSIRKKPKRPLASASIATLKNYKVKVKEVEDHNQKERNRYKKECAEKKKLLAEIRKR